MPENYNEGGQNKWEPNIPEIDLGKFLNEGGEAEAVSPVFDFQQHLKLEVPEQDRVTGEEFSDFVGGVMQENPDLVESSPFVTPGMVGRRIHTDTPSNGHAYTDVSIQFSSSEEFFSQNILLTKVPYDKSLPETASNYWGSSEVEHMTVRDFPYSLNGESVERYVSSEELEALRSFLADNFRLSVPPSDELR